MRFYDRETELAQLQRVRQTAFSHHSQLTVVVGRRRIGKTKLILRSCEATPTVYLFVARNQETALCRQFARTVRSSLGVFVPDGISSFVELFELLMGFGKTRQFNLVIDEFQEFQNINAAVYSGMQDVWDRYKDDTHVNLIASGSVQTMMHRIFMEYGEPLYGRADSVMHIRPFGTAVLKQILRDHCPGATNDDLLALYTITGGVPKYVELLVDRGCFTMSQMVDEVVSESSVFLEEGNILLIQEFGKKFGNYYAILSAIASGRNTAGEIAATLSVPGVGGLLQRLEADYNLIAKHRPIMAKESSQTVRYELADNFLHFWFRYVVRNQDMVQSGQYAALAELIKADYPTYSGLMLERYFRAALRESGQYRQVGQWWNAKKGKDTDQSEIDIVAIATDAKSVLIAEVKRQRKNFKPEWFQQKVERLTKLLFPKKRIEAKCLTLDDM